MNNNRRAEIKGLMQKISDVGFELDAILEQEQDYLDAMPESFQNGEKGEAAQTAIDALQTAADALSEATDSLGEIA